MRSLPGSVDARDGYYPSALRRVDEAARDERSLSATPESVTDQSGPSMRIGMPCRACCAATAGSGMDGIDGLAAGEPVTAEQNAGLVRLRSAPTSRAAATAAGRTRPHPAGLSECDTAGGPFKIVDNDLIPFRLDVAKRIADLNTAIGRPADASIPAADRAKVRTQVDGSSSSPSMVGSRSMPRNSRGRSRKALGHDPDRCWL